jgi:hypothetical protein
MCPEMEAVPATHVVNNNNMPDLVQNNFLFDILTIMLQLFHQNAMFHQVGKTCHFANHPHLCKSL